VAGPSNTQFTLAVHMTTLLAALGPEPQTSEALAGSAGVNPVHVRRVLGRMRATGLVTSKPGPSGGWQLAADPRTTTLADVWRAIQGETDILGLNTARPACPVGRRIQDSLAEIDRDAARALEDELARTTLTELAHGTRAGEFEPAPAGRP
jgi:Rrf2 family protein